MADSQAPLRVMFCATLRDDFYRAGTEERQTYVDSAFETRTTLFKRLGIDVIGTLDDDCLRKGPAAGWPWTWYILADAPDYESVHQFVRMYSQTVVKDDILIWRYVTVEARIGRPLPDRCVIEEIGRFE